jgi:hypothetical protein
MTSPELGRRPYQRIAHVKQFLNNDATSQAAVGVTALSLSMVG